MKEEPVLVKIVSRILFCCLAISIVGAVLKLLHLPGGSYLLLIGLGSLAIVALIKYSLEKTIDGLLTGIVISEGSIAVLFKILHFPYSGWLMNVAIIVAAVWGIKTLFFPDKETPEEK